MPHGLWSCPEFAVRGLMLPGPPSLPSSSGSLILVYLCNWCFPGLCMFMNLFLISMPLAGLLEQLLGGQTWPGTMEAL